MFDVTQGLLGRASGVLQRKAQLLYCAVSAYHGLIRTEAPGFLADNCAAKGNQPSSSGPIF
jgi:hypothetical protein